MRTSNWEIMGWQENRETGGIAGIERKCGIWEDHERRRIWEDQAFWEDFGDLGGLIGHWRIHTGQAEGSGRHSKRFSENWDEKIEWYLQRHNIGRSERDIHASHIQYISK